MCVIQVELNSRRKLSKPYQKFSDETVCKPLIIGKKKAKSSVDDMMKIRYDVIKSQSVSGGTIFFKRHLQLQTDNKISVTKIMFSGKLSNLLDNKNRQQLRSDLLQQMSYSSGSRAWQVYRDMIQLLLLQHVRKTSVH